MNWNDMITKYQSITNTTYSPGRSIVWIVEHYTAGVTSKAGKGADSIAWFNNPSAGASADFVVDDANVYLKNPDIKNRYCWAVGGGLYGNKGGKYYGKAKNTNVISIEICSNNKTGKITTPNDPNYYFTDAAVKNAVELTKLLMKMYNIDEDHVIRHYDVNGKPCPGIIGWNAESGDESKWKAFKKALTASDKPKEYVVKYRAHVEGDGWKEFVGDGEDAGTTGQAKRLECIEIECPEGVTVSATAHIQGVGDRQYDAARKLKIGTTGQAKRLEAFSLKFEGLNGKKAYYQAHAQKLGWSGKISNGGKVGTMGYALRLEAVRIWFE